MDRILDYIRMRTRRGKTFRLSRTELEKAGKRISPRDYKIAIDQLIANGQIRRVKAHTWYELIGKLPSMPRRPYDLEEVFLRIVGETNGRYHIHNEDARLIMGYIVSVSAPRHNESGFKLSYIDMLKWGKENHQQWEKIRQDNPIQHLLQRSAKEPIEKMCLAKYKLAIQGLIAKGALIKVGLSRFQYAGSGPGWNR